MVSLSSRYVSVCRCRQCLCSCHRLSSGSLAAQSRLTCILLPPTLRYKDKPSKRRYIWFSNSLAGCGHAVDSCIYIRRLTDPISLRVPRLRIHVHWFYHLCGAARCPYASPSRVLCDIHDVLGNLCAVCFTEHCKSYSAEFFLSD